MKTSVEISVFSSSFVLPSGKISPLRNNSNIVSRLIAPDCQAATTACKSALDIPAIPKSEFNFTVTSAFVTP